MDASQVVPMGNLNAKRDLVEAVVNALDAQGGDGVIVSVLDFPLDVLHPVVVGIIAHLNHMHVECMKLSHLNFLCLVV